MQKFAVGGEGSCGKKRVRCATDREEKKICPFRVFQASTKASEEEQSGKTIFTAEKRARKEES